MTLKTRIAIIEPTNVEELYRFCQSLLGDPAAQKRWDWGLDVDGNPLVGNEPDQGLPAWLVIRYGRDGPLTLERSPELDAEYARTNAPVVHAIEVSFDTAYSAELDVHSAWDLHAACVGQVGRWCEERNLTYGWQEEHSGQWFDDWRLAASELARRSDVTTEELIDLVAESIRKELV